MTQIAKKIKVDYAHALSNSNSKCDLIHGHTATVIFYFEGEVDKTNGMIFNFSALKEILYNAVIRFIDHNIVIGIKDYELKKLVEQRNPNYLELPYEPTAENLALYCFQMVDSYLTNILDNSMPFRIKKVEWWETENNMASYER